MQQKVRNIIREALINFKNDQPFLHAAALSFIAIFAIPPILLIIIFITAPFIGNEIAIIELHENLTSLLGNKGANLIRDILLNYNANEKSLLRTVIGIFFFMVASLSMFGMIKKSLNQIWRVKPKPTIIMGIYDRLTSIALIFGLSLIFIASLVLDAVMPIIKSYLNETLPALTYITVKTVKFLFSFAASTATFAALFKFLPDVHIKWRVTFMGAFITGILFTIGKGLITWSLTSFDIESMYGATGSMAMFLLWVFYSALIFYFGAEITEQYAHQFSRTIKPNKNAVKIEIKEIEHPELSDEKMAF